MSLKRRSAMRVVAILVAALLLAMPAVPAVAEDTVTPPPVPTIVAGVTVAGIDVGGMTAVEAAAAIGAGFTMPALAPITLDASGAIFTFDPTPAVSLNVAALVADALAATGPTDIAPRYTVSATTVKAFLTSVNTSIAVAPIDSKRTVVKKRLRITRSHSGSKLSFGKTTPTLNAAIDAELAAGGSQQPTVTASIMVRAAKVTRHNIGKTILVVLHERVLRYYHDTKLVKKYRCAIGMPGHRTPTGKWKVIAKSPHPAWHNPGSDWAKNMPAYIAPGPSNPLGLRALYLNAPGIRIHGTNKYWSMGQAASHGCIRLSNPWIVKLYPHIPVGTPVWIVK